MAPGCSGRETGLAELLIPPRSPFIGDHVSRGMVTEDGDLVVVAIQRGENDLVETDLAGRRRARAAGAVDVRSRRRPRTRACSPSTSPTSSVARRSRSG